MTTDSGFFQGQGAGDGQTDAVSRLRPHAEDGLVAAGPPAVKVSVVVPCYNEEQVVIRFIAVATEQLSLITSDYELIFVDDGSRDATLDLLRAASAEDSRIRYLALSRNFGKESAMLAGLTHARGEAVAIMDADLQHPPHLLGEMVPLLDQGFDQVVARRTRAGDGRARSLFSRTYYRIVNRLVDVRLEDGVGDFRVLSRTAVQALLSLDEYNRFSKGLFAWIGFNTTVIDYENALREAGESKWRTRDLFNYGVDSVISFNTKPLRLSIHLGVFVSFAAALYALWVVVSALLFGRTTPGYVTIICAVVGFGGLQMILLGVIGEYLGRIYAESKRRPHFLLKEISEGMLTAAGTVGRRQVRLARPNEPSFARPSTADGREASVA